MADSLFSTKDYNLAELNNLEIEDFSGKQKIVKQWQ
jgi:hypothetical protein